MEEMQPKEAQRFISANKNLIILDVRTPQEVTESRIRNSVVADIRAFDFMEKIKRLDRNKTYLVYCKTGGRSSRACEAMDSMDFSRTINLLGGITAWIDRGFEIVKG